MTDFGSGRLWLSSLHIVLITTTLRLAACEKKGEMQLFGSSACRHRSNPMQTPFSSDNQPISNNNASMTGRLYASLGNKNSPRSWGQNPPAALNGFGRLRCRCRPRPCTLFESTTDVSCSQSRALLYFAIAGLLFGISASIGRCLTHTMQEMLLQTPVARRLQQSKLFLMQTVIQ